MQYMADPRSGGKPTTTLPATRAVDAHSLLHRKASKAARACDGADVLDGLATLQNLTARLVASAHGVSVGSITAALLRANATLRSCSSAASATSPLRAPVTAAIGCAGCCRRSASSSSLTPR